MYFCCGSMMRMIGQFSNSTLDGNLAGTSVLLGLIKLLPHEDYQGHG